MLELRAITASVVACGALWGFCQTSSGQGVEPANAPAAESSSWGWLPLPKVTMPKVELPKVEMSKMAQTALAPVKASVQKIGDGSKRAWEGTKELFRFGQGDDAQASGRAAAPEAPSLWQRMFGAASREDPGPQTIGEFMAGERLQ